MILAIIVVIGSIGLLAWSADQFVLGAARVAVIRHVPSMVVGVVIIGFGTSAPEILVSVLAAVEGEPEVAIGNVIGSNVANLSLMLGIGAAIVPLAVSSRTVRREAPLAVAAVILFGVMVQGGSISPIEGVGLLAIMTAILVLITRGPRADPPSAEAEDLSNASPHRLAPEIGRTIIGLIGTMAAAQLLLWGALEIADQANLSEGFVGVSMVAIGTSLPELVTVVQSARRRETDLIVGNLLGSTLFNALVVGGILGLTGAPAIDDPALTILASLAAAATALLAFLAMLSGHTVSRGEGFALIAAYFVLIPFLA